MMKMREQAAGKCGGIRYEGNIIPRIEANYENLTPLEKNIADFFIRKPSCSDLSAKSVAKQLYVSEASLSRFAQKCGYTGYREFLIYYKNGDVAAQHSPSSGHMNNVLHTYQELLNKSYPLIDEEQIQRIARTLAEKKHIYVYGRGSSGLVAMEMRIRFMRIGLNIEAITDSHIMQMNSVLLNPDCAVIGISVSGKTEEVMQSLAAAERCGAFTLLMTAHVKPEFRKYCNEILLFSVKEYLENSKVISPQFPILVMVDVLFSELMSLDRLRRESLHEYTLKMLHKDIQP